nr:unnamed protein product [Callosobruchus chinensis]
MSKGIEHIYHTCRHKSMKLCNLGERESHLVIFGLPLTVIKYNALSGGSLRKTSIWILLIAAILLESSVTYTKGSTRIPDIYEAITYNLDLNFPEDVFTDHGSKFIGKVLITLKLNKTPYPLEPHLAHHILINYEGLVENNDLFGLYKSSYTNNGITSYVLASQFPAFYARRVFPCFDEPGFKSVFYVSIKGPRQMQFLFNTHAHNEVVEDYGRTKVVHFEPTEKISTYTLGFHIVDFNCTKIEGTQIPQFGVCSRNTTYDSRNFALNIGPKLLGYYSNFTEYDYCNMMGNKNCYKMDVVAIPDYFSGGLENWGMVSGSPSTSCRETDLLYDPQLSSEKNKQRVAQTIAHEFSHQWFGNLVTMKWWSDLYLSEGFGTYFEYFGLEEDASGSTLALQSMTETQDDIVAKFSPISYSKGLSPRNIKYSSVTSKDLMQALGAEMDTKFSIAPADFQTIMENWINQPGYPIINVKLPGDLVTISQKSCLTSGEKAKVKWYVPITYTTSQDRNKFDTRPRLWLLPNDYYPTIVDDSFFLARHRKISYARLFKTINFMRRDRSYFSLASAIKGFNYILNTVGEEPHRDLRSLIYCNGIRYSENVKDWDFLWAKYQFNTDLASEKEAILSGLACSKDPVLLKRSSAEGVDAAIEFFVESYTNIVKMYKSMLVIADLLSEAARKVTTDQSLDRLRAFVIEANEKHKEIAPLVEEAVKAAVTNLKTIRDCKSDINRYFSNSASRRILHECQRLVNRNPTMTLWYLLFIVVTLQSCASKRLPSGCNPCTYRVSLVVPETSLTSTGNSFTGEVEIAFQLAQKTSSLQLHASHDHLTIKTLQLKNAITNAVITATHKVDEMDILTITTTQELEIGTNYNLLITYDGLLSTTDMNGVYKSSYVDGTGTKKYLVATQFESVHARRAFPCFDEPSYKGVFTVDITVPQAFRAMSNTESTTLATATPGTVKYQFQQTPKMSTYLVAFVVSDFTCSEWSLPGSTSNNGVCSRSETATTRNWALEITPKLLNSLNIYTGIFYTESISKVDQVALPDFRSGAMENWGLITEAYMLYDPLEDTVGTKIGAATTIAHELSHSWFGNLVYPEWQLDKQIVVKTVHSALAEDDLPSALALQSDVETPAQIDTKFGNSYDKGGSVLRMVEHLMGSERFKKGVQNYLSLNKGLNTKPANLWMALSIAVDNTVSMLPVTLADIMQNWIEKAGYPLITVTKTNKNTLALKQERFLFSGSDTTTKWYVPITYTTSVDTAKFEKTSPQLWMEPDKESNIQIPDATSWIILNNQQTGFYRVNYDDTLWAEIEKALKTESFGGIGEVNRAQIVDDLFNLAKPKKVSYSKALNIIKFISNDVSYYTWYAAKRGFSFLLDKIGFESDLGKAIKADVLRLMDKVYKSVPHTDLKPTDDFYTLKQTDIIGLACTLQHPECIEMSKSLFSKYRSDGTKPPKDLRNIVYCNALRHSKDSTDWDFLWNVYVKSNSLSEASNLLQVLGCSTDKNILNRYLQKTITDSEIRLQDRATVFSSVLSGNPSSLDIALTFLIEHHKEIETQYATMSALTQLMGLVASKITEEVHLNKLKNMVTSLGETHKEGGKTALVKAEANLKWKKQVEADLRSYYNIPSDDDNGAVTNSVSLFIVTFVSIDSKFYSIIMPQNTDNKIPEYTKKWKKFK